MDRSSRDFLDIQPAPRGSHVQESAEVHAQVEEIHQSLRRLINRDPRIGQVECIWQMLKRPYDILFQAATGYGKSTIWQFTSLLGLELFQEKSITIMITPLVALTRQHVEILETTTHGRARGVALFAQNNGDDLLRQVGQGLYTHGAYIYLL